VKWRTPLGNAAWGEDYFEAEGAAAPAKLAQ
jgi:hypothetical protein